jgi:hypothetical protein
MEIEVKVESLTLECVWSLIDCGEPMDKCGLLAEATEGRRKWLLRGML